MATAPKPKGIGAGIKSLPKWALIAIPLGGAGAFYLFQRRKSANAAATTTTAANTADTTGAAAIDTTGSMVGAGGGSGAIAQGQDFATQISALQGAESTELTDLDAIKTQQTQLLSTESKDLSVDNKSLATETKDLAEDTKDLAEDNSGLGAPVKVGGSSSMPKKPAAPDKKLTKPMASPKVAPAKTAPAKKTGFTSPRPAATVSGGRANSSRGPIPLAPAKPVVKAPAKKR